MSNGENVAIRIRQCRRWTHPRAIKNLRIRHCCWGVQWWTFLHRSTGLCLFKLCYVNSYLLKISNVSDFQGLISRRPHSSFIKFKEKNFRRLLTSSIQREIRHFHSPSRAVTVKKMYKKRVMHVQSFCFSWQAYCRFGSSCCRRLLRC